MNIFRSKPTVSKKQKYYTQAFELIMRKIVRMKIDGIITEDESRTMIEQLTNEYTTLISATLNQK